MTKYERLFLELIKVALGNQSCLSSIPTDADWNAIYQVAEEQNLVAVAFGGIERLSRGSTGSPTGQMPGMDLLMDWLGQTEYAKTMYDEHRNAISDLASFYQSQAIKMLLMKGYGLSLDYPVPEHRPTGDIDVYLFGNKEFADQMVEQKLGLKVEREYHKHSHFTFKGISVENHEKFIDDVTHKSNVRFEEILMNVLEEDTNPSKEGTKGSDHSAQKTKGLIKSPILNCYLPSATWNALFLLRHAGEHFASNEITLRHVLDLGTFFQKHSSKVDWDFVMKVYREERMTPFYNAIATICVRDLGMDASCFHGYTHNEKLADRVLENIFEKKDELPMSSAGIHGFAKVKYGIQKSLRWWNNRWKYKMVYKESMLESFMGLALNRIKN